MRDEQFKVGAVTNIRPCAVRYPDLPSGYTVPPPGSKIMGFKDSKMVAMSPDGFEWIREESKGFLIGEHCSWIPTGAWHELAT